MGLGYNEMKTNGGRMVLTRSGLFQKDRLLIGVRHGSRSATTEINKNQTKELIAMLQEQLLKFGEDR